MSLVLCHLTNNSTDDNNNLNNGNVNENAENVDGAEENGVTIYR